MELLRMQNITKTFTNVVALNNVSFSVQEGEIAAICGENGSGKSTLMNILSGIYPYGSFKGDVIYKGEKCKFKSIRDSEAKGIVIIPQELALCPNLNIAENVFLGHPITKHGLINWDETRKQAYLTLRRIGWDKADVKTIVSSLGAGKQQLIAIAKALAKDAKLLILDEPTAALNDLESDRLLNLLLDLKAQGITSIIISHKLNEIEKVADSITIIRDGNLIESFSRKDKDFSQQRIIRSMVGRDLANIYPNKDDRKFGEVVFETKNWDAFDPLDGTKQISYGININVRAGEIVGLSGLAGAGRSEFALSFFQHEEGQSTRGEIFVAGQKIDIKNPLGFIKNGLIYVTEDRNNLGLLKEESIKKNMTMSSLRTFFHKYFFVDTEKELTETQEMKSKLQLKANSVEDLTNTLSGGNAQKVVLAKAMLTKPKVIILDEPTKGVDIEAKVEIYSLIHEMAKSGVGVLLISSEQPEIIGLSNRCYVMCEGKITAELKQNEIQAEILLEKAIRKDEE